MSRSAAGGGGQAAAFFDVDGTLAKTTIVHAYLFFRRQGQSTWRRRCWFAAYAVKCLGFLIVDQFNRAKFNELFYRDYCGLDCEVVKALADQCHEAVFAPRAFSQALPCMMEHREAGRRIVLVSGSLDFVVGPLARRWNATDTLAASLEEVGGRFTGRLTSAPLSGHEKARQIHEFAAAKGIDLAASHAYGDGIADLPMLDAVGFPHAVNPDRALARVAKARGWSIHHWTVGGDFGRSKI
jgi:HAD superfamily hydrolase (TIGR01490 family)